MAAARALNFRQIEAFAAVISAGSLTGAAELLGRTQPAITRLIQELEAELGYALLHRHGPRVTPTERGLRFHVEVERHLVGLHHLRERAEAIGRDEEPAIEIAAIAALAVGIVPAALAALPALPRQVHLRSAPPEQVVQSVSARTADLGVTSLPVQHPGLQLHWSAEAPCVAVLRADDPLAAEPQVALRSLASRRIISTANPNRLRHRVDAALRGAGVTLGELIDTNTSLTAMGAVRAGLGVALIEPLTPASLPVEGLVTRPVDAEIPFYWGVVTAESQPVPPLLAALIAELQRMSREVLPPSPSQRP